MPVVFGRSLTTVAAMLEAFRTHGDAVRGTYRAYYRHDARSADPYSAARLERPASLAGNAPDVLFPWEQVFVAAATCAGSDYPMLAAHLGLPLVRTELVVEGVFDPRGEFDGLPGFAAPADAAPCFLSLHLAATLTSNADPAALAALHRRVVTRNMVLGALRGIPRTDELRVVTSDEDVALPFTPPDCGR